MTFKVNCIVHRRRLRSYVLTFSVALMVNSIDIRRRLTSIQLTLNAALKVNGIDLRRLEKSFPQLTCGPEAQGPRPVPRLAEQEWHKCSSGLTPEATSVPGASHPKTTW